MSDDTALPSRSKIHSTPTDRLPGIVGHHHDREHGGTTEPPIENASARTSVTLFIPTTAEVETESTSRKAQRSRRRPARRPRTHALRGAAVVPVETWLPVAIRYRGTWKTYQFPRRQREQAGSPAFPGGSCEGKHASFFFAFNLLPFRSLFCVVLSALSSISHSSSRGPRCAVCLYILLFITSITVGRSVIPGSKIFYSYHTG